MVEIGKRAGKRMRALITDMDRPLGNAIGNSLEVIEAIEILQGRGPEDLTQICIALASHILELAEKGTYAECEGMVKDAITSGKALGTLAAMVKAQGGDVACIYDVEKFPKAAYAHDVKAEQDGYIVGVDTENYGVASLLLGAGRNTKEDVIDPAAGIYLHKKTGDFVREGDVIATLYAEKESCFAAAEKRLLAATRFGGNAPLEEPLILDIVE
jgi:pyrimidine-nucleoside phosphorylase